MKSGKRTLLFSVIMSAPGPLVVGLGLMMGKSTTQLADFLRRSAELLAIISSYVVYLIANKEEYRDKKATLERNSNIFAGLMMCLSGGVMLFIAVFAGNDRGGNVIPALAIALMGMIANGIFFFRYKKLSAQSANSILAVQSRLYGAKALMDICVSAVLFTIALYPLSEAAGIMDKAGSGILAGYLVWCGIRTIREMRADIVSR
ncbi:MAG: transporter [Eubacteriaceae bacterium]|nr:transporter [Eubacteriaceae bacterium]